MRRAGNVRFGVCNCKGHREGLAGLQAFKIIFRLQMAPVRFEVNSDAVNIDFNFLSPFLLCFG